MTKNQAVEQEIRVTFDVTRLTAQRYHDYLVARGTDDIPTLANIFAETALSIAPMSVDPGKPETYLTLPMFGGGMKTVIAQFTEALQAEAKK